MMTIKVLLLILHALKFIWAICHRDGHRQP